MIFYIIFIVYILISIKYILDLNKINHNAELISIQNPNEITIKELLNKNSPIIVYNLSSKYFQENNYSINNLISDNPGYIINDNQKNIILSSFNESKQQITNNESMINDFNLKNSMDTLCKSFTDKLSVNLTHNLSIYKGDYIVSKKINKHNNLLFTQLYGETVFYIINPKHKNDINGEKTTNIKKWAFKINLKSGIILSIPANWFYFYEVEKESVLISSYSDNYFTYFYNLMK